MMREQCPSSFGPILWVVGSATARHEDGADSACLRYVQAAAATAAGAYRQRADTDMNGRLFVDLRLPRPVLCAVSERRLLILALHAH